MAVPLWAYYITLKRTSHLRLALIVWVCAWLGFEFLHNRWELTWPWLTLGNGLSMQPSWIQWYAYTGVPGGSLWILAVNALVLYSLDKQHQSVLQRWWPVVAALVLPMALGIVLYMNYTPKGTPQEVVVVQPNYEPHFEKFDISESNQTERTIELALSKLTPTTDWLVLPETVLRNGMNEDAMSQAEGLQRYKMLFSRYPHVQIVGGADSYRIFDTKPAGRDAIRTSERPGGQIRYWEAYNTAFHVDSSGKTALYHKSKLVPGPERMPLRNFFFFLVPIVEHLGGTLEGVGTQKHRSAFGRDAHKAAPMICYESIFGDFSRGYVHAGAQAHFVMSNDGWWDNTPGHLQHRQFAVLRAIETRLDVVRSTNSGSSCFINQRGDFRNATDYNVPVAIKDTMLFRDKPHTFYVTVGDWISWLALVVLVGILLNLVYKTNFKKVD
jgi:apolipoprotein N-acyltransferase